MASNIDPDEFFARLKQARRLLEDGHVTTEAGRQTARLLARLEACLSRPLRVAVLGEANSGKTTLINRLLGSDLLATDVIQNTRSVVRVRHSARAFVELCHADGSRFPIENGAGPDGTIGTGSFVEVGVPLTRLAVLEIIDTPGLAADDPAAAGQASAWRTADIAIWCTIGTQAWRASEVLAWQSLARPIATSVLAVTRADLLSAADREKVRGRLLAETSDVFRNVLMLEGGPKATGEEIAVCLDALAREIRRARCVKAAAIVRRQAHRLEAPGRPEHKPAMSAAQS